MGIVQPDLLGFKEVARQYPDFPRTILRKIDTALRGVNISSQALERAREERCLLEIPADNGSPIQKVIGGAVLRDGTFIRGLEAVSHSSPPKLIRLGEPYVIDMVNGKMFLVDREEPIEEIEFAPLPAFYGKITSRGTPMIRIATAWPPDCLNLTVFGYCHSWTVKKPCKYCSYVPAYVKEGVFVREGRHKDLQGIQETVEEALKEEGRWSTFRLTGGSDPRGNIPYENEVDEYITVLDLLRGYFKKGRVPCRLVSSAFPPELSHRLFDAGATAYEPHLEVWDKKLFELVCPAKAKYYGRQYWIDCAIQAVDIFGRGNVCTQFVAGAELARPYGFQSVDEAVSSTLEGAEFFAQHGVTAVMIILWVGQGSIFFREKQQPGPLEYYVKLSQGLSGIRKRYRLGADFNDYRRCAVHPEADYGRLDYPGTGRNQKG